MTYKRENNRVYGHGQSYTLQNIITAKTLQKTLNKYEEKIQELEEENFKLTNASTYLINQNRQVLSDFMDKEIQLLNTTSEMIM